MKKIESILVATDLRETSDYVTRAAASLAALVGARLHFIHTIDLDVAPYVPRATELAFDELCNAAQAQLDEQIARTVPPGVEVGDRAVEIYLAHRAVVERAHSTDADLIVMGPHRRRAFADPFLGSTADRVIRTADVPCLIVRGPLNIPLRRVVVPVDLSPAANAALDTALDWAGALGGGTAGAPARVSVVHVVPTAFDVPDFRFDDQVIVPELRRQVEAARARAGATPNVEVREEIRWGEDPVARITEYASGDAADLIVLATHGHGFVRRALIGSVAAGVARTAACAVLLVPPGKQANG